jgi:hypothetical protein
MHRAPGTHGRRALTLAAVCALAAGVALGGCGKGSGRDGTTAAVPPPPRALPAAARSLQSAMEAAARAVAAVGPARAALAQLAALLGPPAAQTRDVIVLLAPTTGPAGGDAAAAPAPVRAVTVRIIRAARAQEAFLRAMTAAARAPTRRAALSAIARARRDGDIAADEYARLTLLPGAGLAGLLPASPTFDAEPLRDAVAKVRPR